MPSWKKVIVSGSDATLNSLLVSNGITGAIKGVLQGDPGSSITGSLQGTASFANFATIATNASMATAAGSATTAATASYVNTLNQNVIITGSAAIGTSSLGPSENTLTLGARDSANEGGQLGLNAPGGTYTSASFFDNWQNNVRILRGSNDTSNATVASWNLHTRQMGLAAYTSPSSFSGTVAGLLAFDSSGNIITTSPGGSGTVTSVSASGTVSGITLGGGTITTSGTLTLSGTISGLTTSNLSATAAITNAQLANSSVTVGSTAISLGSSATTIAGLSSVTSTSFVGALTGNATTATQTTNTVGAGSDADIVYSNMAGNDQFRIRTGGASNAGYVEIATADDGTEPIHVRQYTGVFTSLARTATLLDGSGNTTFPGTVTANGTLLTGNTGTVTSVGGTGTVNGISLSGTVTSTGNLTLGGTLSGIGNAQLTNSTITIAGTSTALGSSISQATILAGSGVFSGSAQIPNSSIANAQLANSSITVGSTAISLGSSATTIAGLSSVTSTTFVGALTGTASTATTAATSSKVISQGSTTGGTHYFLISNEDISSGPVAATVRTSNLTYDSATNTLPTTASWATNVVGGTGVSGTTNYIPKFTSTSAIGNSVMYDDGTSIGIGTTGPAAKLDVNGGTFVVGTESSYAIRARNGSGKPLTIGGDASYAYIQSWGGGSLQINNQGNDTLINPNTGNVGIGTTSPNSKLHVVGNTSITGSTNITGSLVVSDSNGISLDTSNFVLTYANDPRVDWGNNTLIESNGITSLDWGAFELYSQDPAVSLNWHTRYLYDSASAISVDWNARRLSNPAGSTLLTWSGNSATLTGTSSWATNVVNNGVTSVATAGSVNGITLTGGTITGTGTITLGGTLSGIGNAQLTNSSVTVGSTAINLGSAATTIAGLTSVTSTNFVGTASVASTVNTVRTAAIDTCYPVFVDSSNGGYGAPEQLYTVATGGAPILQYSSTSGILSATGFAGSLTGSVAGTASFANTASWATNVVNNGVTSVGGTGTVNGISLSGTVTSTGNLTLGGTLSGIGNAQLTNSSITVGSTAISLGATSTTLAGLTSVTSTNFFGTASVSSRAFIGDDQTNTVRYPVFATSTSYPSTTQLAVNSTGITYNPSTNILTTTASLATLARSASAVLAASGPAGTYSIPWMSQKTAGIATYFEGDTVLQYVTSTGQLNSTTFNGKLTSTDARVNGLTQMTGSLQILQSTNTSGSGVRLRQQGTANYWDMYVTASTGTLTNGLQFRYNGGNNGGYLDALANAANIDFTGQHRSLSNTINITGSVDLTGLIVVADGTYTNLNNNHLPQINEALPNVSLSTTINDKRVFGVISDKEEKGRREYAVGAWVSTFDTSGSEAPRLIINSLGEGGMWVCNANGSLENGDYITTSNLPGFGMKQADDILHNYTVAKITEDCLFDSMRTIDFDFSGSAYKKQFVGVTYHCG